jgi:hypothetical protein
MSNMRKMETNLKESIWLLRTFRLLFESFLNATIEHSLEIDLQACDNGPKTQNWRSIFNETGLTELCMDFVAQGIDSQLCLEAINMLVVLLAEPGGSKEVHQSIFRYLKDQDSSLFFQQVKDIIMNIFSWYQKEAENVDVIEEAALSSGEVVNSVLHLPDESIIFTLIQLMCEGDNLLLKNYFREQDGNSESVSITAVLATILDFLSRRESALFTNVSITIVKTIRATVSGPCRENQKYYIINTEMLGSLNRFIRCSRPKTITLTLAWNIDIEMLKECMVDLLRSVIEGFTRDSIIFDRMISSVEMNVTSMLLMPPSEEDQDVLEHGFTRLEAKYMVFLKTVAAPGYESSLSNAVLMKQEESISVVEVRWQKVTHKLYFAKPAILEDLSTDYLLNFFEIDSASQEDKLVLFLEKVTALHTEAKHQQLLKHYGLSYLWARRARISMFLFINAGVLNLLLLMYYKRDYYHNLLMSAEVTDAMTALIIVQIALSFVMTVLYLTVRVPSTYLSRLQNGDSHFRALFTGIMDPMPIWYGLTFLGSILAYTVDKVFSCFFLLEFVVLDSTTQYLLKAVQHPFRQLVATLIILVVAIHIFSGMYFELFSYDMEHNHVEPIYDLWSSLRLALTYGLRGEYGVDHEFYVTIQKRMWLDLAFYFVILATLRHIFFAIIVETFGQLRELKNERDEKLHNSCFICGVERHDFEKAGFNQTFYTHRFIDHHIQNYIHFIFAVLEQPPHQDLGIESYVRECMKKKDVTWVPIGLDNLYVSKARESAEERAQRVLEQTGNMNGKNRLLEDTVDMESGAGGDLEGKSNDEDEGRAASPINTDAEARRLTMYNPQQMKELMETVSAIGQSMAALNQKVDSQEDSLNSAFDSSNSSPNRKSYRQPVSSNKVRHNNQIRGPQQDQLLISTSPDNTRTPGETDSRFTSVSPIRRSTGNLISDNTATRTSSRGESTETAVSYDSQADTETKEL